MSQLHPTKIDWWIVLILIFTVAVLRGSAFPFFFGPPAQSPLGLGIGVLCLALVVWTGWIPFNTNYEIGQKELVIRPADFSSGKTKNAKIAVSGVKTVGFCSANVDHGA